MRPQGLRPGARAPTSSPCYATVSNQAATCYYLVRTWLFICQDTSPRDSEVTFSDFESSYHLFFTTTHHSKEKVIPLSALLNETTN